MSDFHFFAHLVHRRFNELSKHELFVVGDDKRAFEQHYLASFPPGSNPIYKTNTEHDCSCCKNFIRNLGSVVAIIDGKIETVWDVNGAPYPYDVVAKGMDDFVKDAPITDVFRTNEPTYGAEQTKQLLEDKSVKRWNHFHGKVAARHLTQLVGTQQGAYRAAAQVFMRGLVELKAETFDTVLDLIDGKALYRGEEHLPAIKAFQKLQQQHKKLSIKDGELFIWANAMAPASRFRNTVIGTLITDLSLGVDLEDAVRSFEAKVAPTNYKRPKTLITPRMAQEALTTLKELGLEHAVERRFAKISDVGINNVLWADNSVKNLMKSVAEAALMGAAKTKAPKKLVAQDIGVEDFVASVLPTASSIEILFEGTKTNNLMSLTAPMHADSGKLFKWGNDFGWSYSGNITDSIKEKVKRAGGNVTSAKLRVSLAWFNYDDLDIHVYEPNGNRIYFGNKGNKLDVDMNAGGSRSREPVENVSWTTVPDGKYEVVVNQYNCRETTDVGFVVEIENEGKLTHLAYPQRVSGNVEVATIHMLGGKIAKLDIRPGITATGVSCDVWGISTETFVKVNTLMLSPNHWDGQAIGNKHWFFVVDGCKSNEPARGIFNEFLDSGLEKHRKVFEVLGDKTKCQPTDDQLSGLGFSSTRNDTVVLRVAGANGTRTYNVTF